MGENTFRYTIKVSPFISVSDDLSLGTLRRLGKGLKTPFRAEVKRGWGILNSKQRIAMGR